MAKVFPLLYWFGLMLTLVGIALRFWLGSLAIGLSFAMVGVSLILAARLANAVRRPRAKR